MRIITDSGADIQRDEAARMNIDLVSMPILFGSELYNIEEDLNFLGFYKRLKAAQTLPTTSQSSPEAFAERYRQAAAEGEEVLVIVLTSNLSGQHQSAMMAKELVPDARVTVIDSRSATLGERLLVEHAVKMRDEGKGVAEIAEALERLKGRVQVGGILRTLTYLAKGGRLPKTAAVAGNLLSIRPMVRLLDGKLEMSGKARNHMGLVKQFAAGPAIDPAYPVFFGYTADERDARKTREAIRETTEIPWDCMLPIGSLIGTHVGPGAAAYAYIASD